MVAFYVRMIEVGRIALEQVPEYWRGQGAAAMGGGGGEIVFCSHGDRERLAEGERGEHGGRRIIKKKK